MLARRAARAFSRPHTLPTASSLLPRAPSRRCGTGFDSSRAPDATRGYDVEEYAGVWSKLAQTDHPWPQRHTIAVVGPLSDEFAAAAEACVHSVLGEAAAAHVSREERTRWQSVRLQVVCKSPDDFCAVHSKLSRLDGVKMVV